MGKTRPVGLQKIGRYVSVNRLMPLRVICGSLWLIVVRAHMSVTSQTVASVVALEVDKGIHSKHNGDMKYM